MWVMNAETSKAQSALMGRMSIQSTDFVAISLLIYVLLKDDHAWPTEGKLRHAFGM